jgi:RimJ/RimL family protein N-acetyltransferase
MSRHWPLFDLRVRTPRVELRPFTDDDLDELCDLALRGVHDPAHMPFTTPWTDLPPEEQVLGNQQYVWRRRADWTVDSWSLGLGAWEDGVLVGRQDVFAESFPVLRSVETGSWVGREHQGRGLGKELRAAVLHLAFAGLGAERAITGAFDDNKRSLGVTHALGYLPNGDGRAVRRGEVARLLHFSLDADAWARTRRDDITVEGLEACLPLFGL